MGKFWKAKLAYLANHEVFAKIFLANIHRYTESVFDIAIQSLVYSSNFSLPINTHGSELRGQESRICAHAIIKMQLL